ncbi:MAG: serine/threonine protein kinase [Acidobacteriia bacterium]|nr:serine/threonine protein kinase [Terriglobia bacterium]
MKPERWQQLKDVFNRALELDPAHRAAFLDAACAGDGALRTEVESLLASHEDADSFLEQPAVETAAGLIKSDSGDALIGRRLGPYAVTKKLGQGGMGVVYLAEDTRLGRPVAIKALTPQHTCDAEHRERLRREARVAATLSHPAIATVYALEEYGGNLYIICEYVRGRTLFEELALGLLAPSLLLYTATEVARALAAAHEQGIIHRDLKPENVMITPEGAIKILDFGLARFQASRHQDSTLASRLTGAGTFLGTPAYSSPEQLLGLDVDFRTDIFSFGVMLYEMASGKHPFAATDSITTIARILEAEPVALARVRPLVPPELDQIVRRCLHKIPGQRYGATRELVADLERLKSADASSQTPSQPDQEQAAVPVRTPRLRPLWWWQFHQAWVGCMYYGMLYPMWRVKVWTPGSWGPLFFFMSVAAVGVAANLRFYLWFASAFYPAELVDLRRHISRWIRVADILFVSLLLIGGIAIHGAHEVWATLIFGVAVGSMGGFLLIEPTTTRAAFAAEDKTAK